MPIPAIPFSTHARRATEQPISYYMQLAIENPDLISLAAGLVDQESLPVADAGAALADIFADPVTARSALQYGTTQGLATLRERVWRHVARLDGVPADTYGLTAAQVLITTGSQQSLYMLSETLFDDGDYVIIRESKKLPKGSPRAQARLKARAAAAPVAGGKAAKAESAAAPARK